MAAADEKKQKGRYRLPEPDKPELIPQSARDEHDNDFYLLRIDSDKAGFGPVFAMRREVRFKSQDVWLRFRDYYPGMDYNAFRLHVIATRQAKDPEHVARYKSEFNRFIDESLEKIGLLYEQFFSVRHDEREKRKAIVSKISVPDVNPMAVYTLTPHSKRIFSFFEMADDAITMAYFKWLNGEIDSDQLAMINREITRNFRVLAQRLTYTVRACFMRLSKMRRDATVRRNNETAGQDSPDTKATPPGAPSKAKPRRDKKTATAAKNKRAPSPSEAVDKPQLGDAVAGQDPSPAPSSLAAE